jgi:peptidoglycan-associated lipoprotein
MFKKLLPSLLLISLASCNNKFSNSLTKDFLSKKDPAKLERVVDEKSLVFFETDSYKLSDEGKKTIEKIIISLKENTKTKVKIEGYCDERGSDSYNKKLGKNRASAVKKFLVKNGIKSSRIKTISFGKENPINHNHDEKAWSENRRAIAIFVEKK